MPAELLRLDLRLRRRSLVGTAVGAAAYLFVVIAAYPSFRHDTSFDQVIATNPSAAAAFGINGSITSPAGWLSSNLYANLGPLLALLLTIGYGASAIAGQNSEGLLGIVATQPLSRVRIVRAKLACLLATAAVVPVVAYAVLYRAALPAVARLGQVGRCVGRDDVAGPRFRHPGPRRRRPKGQPRTRTGRGRRGGGRYLSSELPGRREQHLPEHPVDLAVLLGCR